MAFFAQTRFERTLPLKITGSCGQIAKAERSAPTPDAKADQQNSQYRFFFLTTAGREQN
jgi:hypothetical protein